VGNNSVGFLVFRVFSATTKSGSMEKFQIVARLLLGLVRKKWIVDNTIK